MSEWSIDRRGLLAGAVSLAAAASPLSAAAQVFATVETDVGKIRGVDIDGIKQFRGVPYGAPTGGRNRFRPPQQVRPWSGVRDAYGYGAICPQPYSTPAHPFGALIDFDLHVGAMSEDCLNLNVWTPGLSGGKRPVLVYFHGGGMNTGSGNHDLYIGDRLARFGDVVVVTVNHRLSAFGYINLSDLGAPKEFSDSGNAGLLDLVAALGWVRRNIAAFGGDPGNVTIFGQSGGGTKTAAMMAMPAGRGLFHRAAIQSGGLQLTDRTAAAGAAQTLLKHLGVGKGQWAKLQRLPAEAFVEAQVAIGTYDWISGKAPWRPQPQFSPFVDGRGLPHALGSPAAFRLSSDIPTIIGYCLADRGWTEGNFDLDEAGLLKVAERLAGGRGQACLDIYGRSYPAMAPFVTQGIMLTDMGLLPDVHALAAGRAQLQGAPTYVYRFDWPSKAFGGVFGATHGMDMSLVFYNTHQPTIGGDTPEAREMATLMSEAWVSFARTGQPVAKALPGWRPFTPDRRETMVINSPVRRLVDDPNREARQFWASGAGAPA
jgi:para-nitrobenzyl esterase